MFTLLVRAKDLSGSVAVSPHQHQDELIAKIREELQDLQFEYSLGKLSSEDFEKTKLDLEKDLERAAGELNKLPAEAPAPKQSAFVCPHCGAEFGQEMRFCGACGKPMAGGSS